MSRQLKFSIMIVIITSCFFLTQGQNRVITIDSIGLENVFVKTICGYALDTTNSTGIFTISPVNISQQFITKKSIQQELFAQEFKKATLIGRTVFDQNKKLRTYSVNIQMHANTPSQNVKNLNLTADCQSDTILFRKETYLDRKIRSSSLMGLTVMHKIGFFEYNSSKVKKIIDLCKNDSDLIILDIRTPTEFKDGHLENAQNIDFYGQNFSSQINNLPKHRPIVLYCRSGSRSSSAFTMMQGMGFAVVYNLTGGINGWTSAGFPTVK